MSGDLNSTVAGEQSPDSTTNSLRAALMSAESTLTTQVKSCTCKKAISMTQGDSTLHDRTLQLKGSMSRYPVSEGQRQRQESGSSLGIPLPKLLILLFLFLIATPSSVLAVPVCNCSVARFRHARDLRHGPKNAIEPGSPVSFVQLSRANNLGLAGEPTNMLTKAPVVSSISILMADTTSATTLINQRPLTRPNTRTNSVPKLVSVWASRVSTLPISNTLTSIPTLHPTTIPIGIIISDPPKLTFPPLTTVTNPSEIGVLFRSSSTTVTSQSTRMPVPTNITPTTTPPTDPDPDQHKNIHILVIGLSLILLGGLVASFFIYRHYSRKRRAQGPKREVELVEILAPRKAQAARDDLLNRTAGVDERASRNSLDDIIAASGRTSTISRAAPVTHESGGATSAATTSVRGDEERRGRRSEKEEGSRGGGNEEEWETLPPYAR